MPFDGADNSDSWDGGRAHEWPMRAPERVWARLIVWWGIVLAWVAGAVVLGWMVVGPGS